MSAVIEIDIAGFDRQVFAQGHHWHAYRFLGAHVDCIDGVDGVRFATWAPRARAVGVAGDFNGWDARRYPLRGYPGGIWSGFVPGAGAGACYKLDIQGADGRRFLKADPYAQRFEAPPRTASVVAGPSRHDWTDAAWLQRRATHDWLRAPMSVYEMHLGSWKRHPDGRYWSYRELAAELPAYVRDLGFTHVELMPVMEHPYDPSWGYQVIGNFAPTARFGVPDDFRALVDAFHAAGVGVILDWVPAHFPRDAHGLARFDGTALYEHADPRRGEHPDWNTLIYDYGRPEVRNYLLASALYWLEEFHVDGLRVDAVASMLYLDYSRQPGHWLPNPHGGRENLDAVAFLRELNSVVHTHHAGAVVIAEESTAWPQVSRPTSDGGLGFSMKWDMGWMHDTLSYLARDPVHRRYHHDQLTFSQLYRYSENYVLPLSHDEVVHGKRSLLHKMAGDRWQQFANLRLLYAYWMSCPGKKLLFMGQEFAQHGEWNQDAELDWSSLADPAHAGIRRLVRDLNTLYRALPVLHHGDFDPQGFEWLDCHDAERSTLSYLRRAGDAFAVVVLNFTPVPHHGFRVAVPQAGRYVERLNSDSQWYGGSDTGGPGAAQAEPVQWMGRPWSIQITLPPLGALILSPEG